MTWIWKHKPRLRNFKIGDRVIQVKNNLSGNLDHPRIKGKTIGIIKEILNYKIIVEFNLHDPMGFMPEELELIS